ncbi:glycerate kinase [Corynebacterium mayonis]|uniref:glycerate kinase family protein n=1 Tax=Corynebacterium mayonis TaxID=3062461 RepID=UPI003140254C
MKVIVVSDSFKGALGSQAANEAIASGVRAAAPEAEIIQIPVADGGEGTVAALASISGSELTQAKVCGVFPGESIEASFALLNHDTAAIETASCAGLPLAAGRLRPGAATTYGVGELIRAAVKAGAKKVIVGAGGSATTDAGCGAAAALGTVFLNDRGEPFVPTGDSLRQVAAIEASPVDDLPEITVMCDIDNPLYGPQGAAHVFGPQKGADPEMAELLDAGLRHVAGIIERDLGVDVAKVPGAGAAGGLAGGLMAFAGATLTPGIDTVLEANSFSQVVAGADLVITGEGRIDGQSLAGKVPVGVARRAGGIPVVVLAGAVDEGIEAVYEEGITAVFPINRQPLQLEQAMAATAKNLQAGAENVLRLVYRA